MLRDERRRVHEQGLEDQQAGSFDGCVVQVESLEQGGDEGGESRFEDGVREVGEDAGEGEEVVLLCRGSRSTGGGAQGFDDPEDYSAPV